MPLTAQQIEQSPKFKELVAKRRSLNLSLTVVTLIIYFGFILLVAFDPKFLGQKIGEGVMTLGIPVGLAVIVATFLIVGFYVVRANATFDVLSKQIVEESK
jgi:uncharacterized membrane protein (DUF485 family)